MPCANCTSHRLLSDITTILTTLRYPEELADRRWDNVGLLVDNSEEESKKHKPVVMLTNDLTWQVAVDAIKQGASVIVSYRGETPSPRFSLRRC